MAGSAVASASAGSRRPGHWALPKSGQADWTSGQRRRADTSTRRSWLPLHLVERVRVVDWWRESTGQGGSKQLSERAPSVTILARPLSQESLGEQLNLG